MILIELNRLMEARWRRGEITFDQFNWHLKWVCGV